MRLARPPKKKARIEIIPMIDTMFFLLVFFMVATLSMTIQRGLSVNLPQSSTNSRNEERRTATLTITKEGKLFFDKEEISSPEDAALMISRREGADGRPVTVIINADRDVEHGRVVEVMDSVRQGGVTRVAIAVTPQ